MNTNPVLTAYTNLGIMDEEENVAKPVASMGLLSRNSQPKETPTANAPLDRVKLYVKDIRKARKQINNG
jgi:hypothetical protein